jgi:hypothetical protein
MVAKSTHAARNPAPVATVASAFRANTQPTIRRPGLVLSTPLGSAPASLPDTQIPPTVLLRAIYIEINCVVTGNTTNVVAFNPDAPLNALSLVSLHDSQGTPFVGAFDSFTLSMAQKWFGFKTNGDPTTSAVYSFTAGAVSAGGSFTMVLRIPVEAVSRTGIGSQINTDTQSPLVLSLTANSLSNIYAVAPSTTPQLSVVISYGGYWNQSGNPESFATPVAVGTLNYVNWTNYPNLAGQNQFQLGNTGMGNPWANLMFINRLASNEARSDSAFANPFKLAFRGNEIGTWSQLLWKHLMSEAYDISNPAQDSGLGGNPATGVSSLNQGVYNVPFNDDFGLQPGASLNYGLLDTKVGDSVEVTGNWPTQSQLYEIVNFYAVSGPITAIQGH